MQTSVNVKVITPKYHVNVQRPVISIELKQGILAGAGDMLKANYDPNGNGNKVAAAELADNATKLAGQLASYYATAAALAAKQDALGFTPEDSSNKNQANGYAGLDASGKIASAQLPSYVDDVIESANYASLPSPGETGKIYVTLDTNREYRWSGSAYIEIVASPGSTDALSEGLTNLYFTAARAVAAVVPSGNGFPYDNGGALSIKTAADFLALLFTGFTDYSGTSTILGWSSFTNKTLQIFTAGKLMLIYFFIAGTSNDTVASFTIPGVITASYRGLCVGQNNGSAYGISGFIAPAGSSTMNCYWNEFNSLWTASGTKSISGSMFVEIN